ncbi:MAG TPA: cation:proton antiporter, partial [Polyangiaceae bacterium]|nr:cation:proton antiporter [Polyangiaceae bacterium]
MEQTFAIAALWFGLALVATALSARLAVSGALLEIVVGAAAGALATRFVGPDALGAKLPWVTFVSSTGAVLLTFLAGAELDPGTLRARWREVLSVGLVSFAAPFLGCAAIARFVLDWSWPASWLAGIALSTTSMAVVYAVMLETGLNKTAFGKGILGACFVTDLG